MSRVRGWAVAVLIVSLIELVALVAHLLALGRVATLFERFLLDPNDDGALLDAASSAADRLALVTAVGALVGVVLVIGWLHAGVKVVGTLGLGPLRHSSGWAIGAWFVPFLNLVRVPQIVADVYRAGRRPVGRVGFVVGGWWAIWLIDAAVARSVTIRRVPTTAEQVREMLQITSASEVLGLLSTLATLALVLLLTSGLARAAAAAPTGVWAPPVAAYPPAPNPMFGYPQPVASGAPQYSPPVAAPYPPSTPQYAAPLPPAYDAPPARHLAPPTTGAPEERTTYSPPTMPSAPGPETTSRTYLPE
jgi:hypothetical protein